MAKYTWLEKRVKRSVDQLRLWSENPRLDPEENHLSVSDFATDLIIDNSEKESFLRLTNSIVTMGFIAAEPVVVWQNQDNKKFYVAEGNRRILALKLLRSPDKAPRSIRRLIREKSERIDRDEIEKINVCVAPSFEECEWYINQRNSSAGIDKRWSRHQQQRWIAYLYDRHSGDVDILSDLTSLSESELKNNIRILKIRDLLNNNFVLKNLSDDEKQKIKSHRLPMSIFERWFSPQVLEAWGLEYDGVDVRIVSNTQSFFEAYSAWIKLVLHRDDDNVKIRINTRTITTDFDKIFAQLPTVSFAKYSSCNFESSQENENENENEKQTIETECRETNSTKKGDPTRSKLIIENYLLITANYKLDALFKELQRLPVTRYKNCTGSSIRVFLDLAILEYIETEDISTEIREQYHAELRNIPLKNRLEFLKSSKLPASSSAHKIVAKLLNSTNDFSLDTLNSYIHGRSVHHTDQKFLNRFWDFLFPLFEYILEIREE